MLLQFVELEMKEIDKTNFKGLVCKQWFHSLELIFVKGVAQQAKRVVTSWGRLVDCARKAHDDLSRESAVTPKSNNGTLETKVTMLYGPSSPELVA